MAEDTSIVLIHVSSEKAPDSNMGWDVGLSNQSFEKSTSADGEKYLHQFGD